MQGLQGLAYEACLLRWRLHEGVGAGCAFNSACTKLQTLDADDRARSAPAIRAEILRQAHAHRRSLAKGSVHRRSELTKRLKMAEARIGRLHNAVADGLVTDTDLFRRDLATLHTERDECTRLLEMLDTDIPQFRQALSKQQASTIAADMKRRLLDAPKPLQRRYVRGPICEIVLD